MADLGYPNTGIAVKMVPLFFYGWGIELLQRGVPGRYYEWWDLAANGMGLVVGAVLGALIRRATTPPARGAT